MSVRGVRIHRRSDPQYIPSILIEKNGIDGGLLLQNGAILALDSEAYDVERRTYSKILDAYGLLGLLRISSDESLLVVVTGVLSIGQLNGVDILKITKCDFVPLRTIGSSEFIDARIPDLQRLLSSGMFYFASSPNYDLTSCSQRRETGLDSDSRFFWNHSLHFSFDRYKIDTSKWLLKCIAGSVLIRTVYVGHRTGKVALISRLSCERVGTRFNVRGANHLGQVANFVETEQLIIFDEKEVSFVQVRGSIPLFWEQPGVQVGSHKVKLRAFEASAPAYHRHMTRLKSIYGDVTVVTLLGRKEGERVLSEAFRTQHKNTKMSSSIQFIEFDYHAQMRMSKDSINKLKKDLIPFTKKYNFYSSLNNRAISTQNGVIRTNCLDCLDRTNSVQTVLGLNAVFDMVDALKLDRGKVNVEQRIEEILRDLWVQNGDQCSTIYAGTGALDGKSKLKDASRSIARTIQNNLMDSSKQEAFDLFLTGVSFDQRLFDQASNILPPGVIQEYPDAVSQLVERSREIVSSSPMKIFVGTWNVNGGKNINNVAFKNESNLSHWIFPTNDLVIVEELNDAPDIVAIGVEELVDLNASNMVKASTTNQRLWAEQIRKTLNQKAPYVLVASEQLVGVCLFLFVRPRITSSLKDFAVTSVKTGMGGATGNKGSVAFRMVVNSTGICFVCSHFAAGQSEVLGRNEDFATAVRKIRFPHGREIDSHDIIFWFGDFNYRINLSGEEVKRALGMGQLDQLVPNDQLTQQKAQGLTFIDYNEGPLRFAPTYKYDTFSDDYDTSEKCRVPAWTDRILWKEQRAQTNTKLMRYDRAELKTSDHRPVGALFSANTFKVDTNRIPSLLEDVISCMGPPDATIICNVEGHQRFPQNIYPLIVNKLQEIRANILACKYERNELWIVLESGELALAALSMDGLPIGGSNCVSVRLRSPDWSESIKLPVDLQQIDMYTPEDETIGNNGVEFEFDDDEELSTMSLPSGNYPPDRSRPPSARSEIVSVPSSSAISTESEHTQIGLASSVPNGYSFAIASWSSPNLQDLLGLQSKKEDSKYQPLPPSRQTSMLLEQAPSSFEHNVAPPPRLPPASVPSALDKMAPPIPTRPAPPPPPRPQVPVIPPRPKGW